MANLRHLEWMEVKAHTCHDRLARNDSDSVRDISNAIERRIRRNCRQGPVKVSCVIGGERHIDSIGLARIRPG